MFRTYESFSTRTIEYTKENPDKKVFSKLNSNDVKWLKIYLEFDIITKIVRKFDIDENNELHLYLNNDKILIFNLKLNRENLFNIFSEEFDRNWDQDIKPLYQEKLKSNHNKLSEFYDAIISLKSYAKLIEAGFYDISSELQKKNLTFMFDTDVLKDKKIYIYSKTQKQKNITYLVYNRGVVQVDEGQFQARNLNKAIKIENFKDYDKLFDIVYEDAIKEGYIKIDN